jgi:hypothetical protein
MFFDFLSMECVRLANSAQVKRGDYLLCCIRLLLSFSLVLFSPLSAFCATACYGSACWAAEGKRGAFGLW